MPAVTTGTCPSPDVPMMSQETRLRVNFPVPEPSFMAQLCRAAGRDILKARVSQAAALPHAHPWSHHPLFGDLLASLAFGASESTPEAAAPRDWHWFGATVVYLGLHWTGRLCCGGAVGGLGAAPAQVHM